MSGIREEATGNGMEFNSGPSVSQPNTTRTTPDSGLGDDRNQQDRGRQIPPGFQQQPNPPPAQQGNFYPHMRAPHQQIYYSNSDNHYDYKNNGHKVGQFDAPEAGRIYEHQHMVHPSNPRAVVYRNTMSGSQQLSSMHYDDNYHPNHNGPPSMGPNMGPGLLGGPPVPIHGRVPPHNVIFQQVPPNMPPQNMQCSNGQYDSQYVHNQQMQHPPTGAVIATSTAVSTGYDNDGSMMANAPHPGNHQYYSPYQQNIIPNNGGVMMYPSQPPVMMSAPSPVSVFMAPPPPTVIPTAPGQPVMMVPHQQYVQDGNSNAGQQLYLVQPQQQMRQPPGMSPALVVRQPNPRGERLNENPMDNNIAQNVSQPPPNMVAAPPTRLMPLQPYYVGDQQAMPPGYPPRMPLPAQGQPNHWIPGPGIVSYLPTSYVPNHYNRGGRMNRSGRGGNFNYNRDGKNKSYSRQSSVSTDHGIQKNDIDPQTIANLQQLSLDAGGNAATGNVEPFPIKEVPQHKEDESMSLPDEPTQPSPRPLLKEYADDRACPVEDPSQKPTKQTGSPRSTQKGKEHIEVSKKMSEPVKQCTYCRSKGKSDVEYTGHVLRENGKVRCPDALINLECGYCHLKGGPDAHATPFCPKKQDDSKRKSDAAPLKEPARHSRDNVRTYQSGQHYEHRQQHQQYGPQTRGGQSRRNNRPAGRNAY